MLFLLWLPVYFAPALLSSATRLGKCPQTQTNFQECGNQYGSESWHEHPADSCLWLPGRGGIHFYFFFLYLCLSVTGSRKQIRWYINMRSLLKMLMSCAAMFLYLFTIKQFLPNTLWALILLVLSGAGVYLLVLFLSGELKDVTNLFVKRHEE